MRAPFVSSRDSVSVRPLIVLRLEAADGAVGYGEAAPLEGYDGVTIDDARAALEDCRALLAESDGGQRSELLQECARAAVLPQATAAVDLALWDLTGRRLREPVWRLLGARDRGAGRGQRDDRRDRPGGRRARGRRRGGRGFWLSEGQGRGRRRRRTPGGGPGGGRVTDADQARRERRLVDPGGDRDAPRARAGRDSNCARNRSAAPRRSLSSTGTRRSRWRSTRAPPAPARSTTARVTRCV